MQLTINVDETMFKDIIEKELGAFSQDELHDIVKEMIKNYLSDSEIIKNLFVETKYDRYSYGGQENVPTKLLSDIVSKVDLTNQCEEITNALTKEIIDNSRSIVTELIVKSIAKSLSDKWQSEGWLSSAIMSEIIRRENNK